MSSYARLTPVYMSQITELKEKDNDTWQAFQTGHFSVNKLSVPFSTKSADHALEQQNRAMKVLGGIKGIHLFFFINNPFLTLAPTIA